MRGKDDRRVGFGDFVEFLDENRALGLQAFDHVAVVDDFVPDIDGGPIGRAARSTESMARTTPAQKPRGEHRTTFKGGFSALGQVQGS